MPVPADGPLRIALFTGNYHHVEDGVSRTLNRLVRYLLADGHEVLVVGPPVEDPPLRARRSSIASSTTALFR